MCCCLCSDVDILFNSSVDVHYCLCSGVVINSGLQMFVVVFLFFLGGGGGGGGGCAALYLSASICLSLACCCYGELTLGSYREH